MMIFALVRIEKRTYLYAIVNNKHVQGGWNEPLLRKKQQLLLFME
jgi:hypothetical protein